jgi:hypothetical protein
MAAEAGNFIFNTGARRAKPMRILFADGEHAVPEWVVAEMGEETLSGIAPALAQHTFEEFSASISRQLASERLSKVQASVFAAHFGRVLS